MQDLLSFLGDKYGEDLANYIYDDGDIASGLRIFVDRNGENQDISNQLDFEFQPGDIIKIFLITAGG